MGLLSLSTSIRSLFHMPSWQKGPFRTLTNTEARARAPLAQTAQLASDRANGNRTSVCILSAFRREVNTSGKSRQSPLSIDDRSRRRQEQHRAPRPVSGTKRGSPRVHDRRRSRGRDALGGVDARRDRQSPRRLAQRHSGHRPLKLVQVGRVLNCATEVVRPLHGIVELALCFYRVAERVQAHFLVAHFLVARDHRAAQAI